MQSNAVFVLFSIIIVSTVTVAQNREDYADKSMRNQSDEKIINGEPVDDISEIPYFVRIYKTADGSLNCGGSLISGFTVLTAGHCVHK